uniref:RHS repeat-associated core domain-containing protein n=1 Tax=uncultured Bacteroides sp. TaxID=162156 RepID=UPI0025E705D1
NWYDYGARHYDAALGRWNAVDTMAEKYYGVSPYNYCLNNPFKLIDLNGMWPGNPLLQPFGRYQYGSNAAVNSFKFIHNTVAAVVNAPINIINQLADETEYIYNNGVSSYLSSGTKNIGDAVSSELSYRVNTPISQQAEDTWQAMKDPQNWEKATATAALMLSPMKGSGTAGARQAVSAVAKGGTKGISKNLLDVKDVLRIENAATKIGKPIHVVGSRASGKATAYSDWDYVIEGLTNKNWKSIKNSLPGAKSIIDNVPRNIDIIREPLDITKPYIKINPK